MNLQKAALEILIDTRASVEGKAEAHFVVAYVLSVSKCHLKNQRLSLTHYRKAADLQPKNDRFQHFISAQYAIVDDHGLALRHAKAAQRLAPVAKRAAYDYDIARCYISMCSSEKDDAVRHFRAFVGLNSDGSTPLQLNADSIEPNWKPCLLCSVDSHQPVELGCNHSFCEFCVEAHCEESASQHGGHAACPVCKQTVSAVDNSKVAAACQATRLRQLKMGDPHRGHLCGALMRLADLEFSTAIYGSQVDEKAFARGAECLARAEEINPFLSGRQQRQHAQFMMLAQAAKATADEARKNQSRVQFGVGDVVEIVGLKTKTQYNGEFAIVEKPHPTKPGKLVLRVPLLRNALSIASTEVALVYSATVSRTSISVDIVSHLCSVCHLCN